MSNEFINLLKNGKLREEIINYIHGTCSYAGTIFDNPGDDFPPIENEDDLWYSAFEAGKVYAEDKAVTADNSFRKYFFDKISQPWPIALEELTETLYDMVRSKEFAYTITDEAISHLYDVFLSYVDSYFLKYRRSLPLTICRGAYSPLVKGFLINLLENKEERLKLAQTELDKAEKKPIWEKNGITVVRESYLIENRYYINAVVEGFVSPVSLGKVSNQISRCLPSIIRSFALSYPPKGTSFTNFDNPPMVDENFFENYGVLVKSCLDLFFAEPTKKDSIERRMRNAIHLLAESDNQTIDAIGLALSITAVEALLAEGVTEISEKLSRNVATLLEPDLSRRSNAEEFTKKLYNLRSRALHGEKIEVEPQTQKSARHLAAAVLVAVLNRCDFLKRADYAPEKPEDLLKELRGISYTPGQLTGVPELNIRNLWAGKKD